MELPETSDIYAACRRGQINIVESLLNSNPSLATTPDPDDRLPLHNAIIFSHLPIVTLLLDLAPLTINAVDGSGWTALMMASSLQPSPTSDPLPIVNLVLSRGAELLHVANSGQSALHLACSKCNLDVVKVLIDQPYGTKELVNKKDKMGRSALMRAAAVGCGSVVRFLLDSGAGKNASDNDGLTVLHHAIAEGHGDVAGMLIRSGADLTREDKEGRLAIDLAPDAKVRDYVLRIAAEEGKEFKKL